MVRALLACDLPQGSYPRNFPYAVADDPNHSGDSSDDRASLPPSSELLWSEFRMLSLLILVAAVTAAFVLATGVFLLAFASVLVAVVFHDLAAMLERNSPLSLQWALVVVFVAFVALVGTFTWLTAPNVIDQLSQAAQRIPQAVKAIDDWLTGWLGVNRTVSVRQMVPPASSLIGSLPMIATTTFGVLASVVVVFALGLYLAAHPRRYRDGIVRLFAPERRRAVRETLDEIGWSLERWMRGQLLAMVIMGVLSYIGLKLLGVPLALSLALTTALLEMVPYLGAIVAAVPVVLVALTESWTLALYALLVYTALQMIEGYAMVPQIQRRAIFVPPAVLIFAQVLLGVLFGVVGLVLATPLCGALAVVVRRAYVDTVLEE